MGEKNHPFLEQKCIITLNIIDFEDKILNGCPSQRIMNLPINFRNLSSLFTPLLSHIWQTSKILCFVRRKTNKLQSLHS